MTRAILLTSVLFGLPGCVDVVWIAADAVIEVTGDVLREPEKPLSVTSPNCNRTINGYVVHDCRGWMP